MAQTNLYQESNLDDDKSPHFAGCCAFFFFLYFHFLLLLNHTLYSAFPIEITGLLLLP